MGILEDSQVFIHTDFVLLTPLFSLNKYSDHCNRAHGLDLKIRKNEQEKEIPKTTDDFMLVCSNIQLFDYGSGYDISDQAAQTHHAALVTGMHTVGQENNSRATFRIDDQ